MSRSSKALIAAVVTLFLPGCEREPGISADLLQRNTAVNDVVPLSKLDSTTSRWSHVCVLFPYQERAPSGAPGADKANAALLSERYSASEERWALVFVDGENHHRIDVIERTRGIDIWSIAEKPAQWFFLRSCTETKNAAFYRFEYKGRNYVAFGSMDP